MLRKYGRWKLLDAVKLPLALILWPFVAVNYWLRRRNFIEDAWFDPDGWLLSLGYYVGNKKDPFIFTPSVITREALCILQDSLKFQIEPKNDCGIKDGDKYTMAGIRKLENGVYITDCKPGEETIFIAKIYKMGS